MERSLLPEMLVYREALKAYNERISAMILKLSFKFIHHTQTSSYLQRFGPGRTLGSNTKRVVANLFHSRKCITLETKILLVHQEKKSGQGSDERGGLFQTGGVGEYHLELYCHWNCKSFFLSNSKSRTERRVRARN